MDTAGAGGGRHSASPEDRSEGNETLSAPSEFLAEFLSAIMRRQYAEALKYCRLILQYEPHNATARSFYPLLRHKLHAPTSPPAPAPAPAPAAAPARTKHTEEETPAPEEGADSSGDEDASPSRQEELMEHSASESEGEEEEDDGAEGAGASCASGRSRSSAGDGSELELDSSEALPSSPSVSLSRRTDRTDRTDSASGASCCWESTGSASASRSEPARAPPAPAPVPAPDDNGNAPPPLPAHTLSPPLLPDDLENDNAAAGGDGCAACPRGAGLQSDSVSSLRRLRAQFACSIK